MKDQTEKQAIEEMAKVIEITEQIARDAVGALPSPTMYAKDLYWHGYRRQREDGAECPICHGTGRIGTTDWLTKGISKKQLAEEKARAIAEHEQHIKTEAVNGFVKRVKEKLFTVPTVYNSHFGRMIDDIAKEMTEEET